MLDDPTQTWTPQQYALQEQKCVGELCDLNGLGEGDVEPSPLWRASVIGVLALGAALLWKAQPR